MSGRSAASDAIVDGLADWGLEAFAFVPSSHIAPVIRGLQDRGVAGYLANREEEAVGIAGGLALGGLRAAVLMQDNGFGNALTALGTFAAAYHVGLPLIANSRGGPGEYNSMIHAFSDAVPDLLRAIGIRVERLGPGLAPSGWRTATAAAAELARIGHRPVVVLADLLHPCVSETG